MILPPNIIRFRVHKKDRRGFGIWIPLFLFWPFFLLLAILIFPVLAVAEIIMRLAGYPLPLCSLMIGLYYVVSATRGTRVYMTEKKDNNLIDISIV